MDKVNVPAVHSVSSSLNFSIAVSSCYWEAEKEIGFPEGNCVSSLI